MASFPNITYQDLRPQWMAVVHEIGLANTAQVKAVLEERFEQLSLSQLHTCLNHCDPRHANRLNSQEMWEEVAIKTVMQRVIDKKEHALHADKVEQQFQSQLSSRLAEARAKEDEKVPLALYNLVEFCMSNSHAAEALEIACMDEMGKNQVIAFDKILWPTRYKKREEIFDIIEQFPAQNPEKKASQDRWLKNMILESIEHGMEEELQAVIDSGETPLHARLLALYDEELRQKMRTFVDRQLDWIAKGYKWGSDFARAKAVIEECLDRGWLDEGEKLLKSVDQPMDKEHELYSLFVMTLIEKGDLKRARPVTNNYPARHGDSWWKFQTEHLVLISAKHLEVGQVALAADAAEAIPDTLVDNWSDSDRIARKAVQVNAFRAIVDYCITNDLRQEGQQALQKMPPHPEKEALLQLLNPRSESCQIS